PLLFSERCLSASDGFTSLSIEHVPMLTNPVRFVGVRAIPSSRTVEIYFMSGPKFRCSINDTVNAEQSMVTFVNTVRTTTPVSDVKLKILSSRIHVVRCLSLIDAFVMLN